MALPAELEQTERVLAARQHHADFLTHHPEFKNPIDLLLQDPHVAPAFKQAVSTPSEFLKHRHDKAQRRRLLDQPECVTGFGGLPPVTAEQCEAMDDTLLLA